VSSFVKTDLNWSLGISALNLLSDSVWWSLLSDGIRIVSTFRLLMSDQNRLNRLVRCTFCRLFLFLYVHFVCLTKCVMTGLVSVYFMGVEGFLFTFVQSF